MKLKVVNQWYLSKLDLVMKNNLIRPSKVKPCVDHLRVDQLEQRALQKERLQVIALRQQYSTHVCDAFKH